VNTAAVGRSDALPVAIDDWMAAAARAASAAGTALVASGDAWRLVSSSEGRDVKLAADCNAERVVLEELRATGLPILSEEAGADVNFGDAEWAWVVDPLDGTFNYQRGFPVWCVSIALMRGGEPTAGVIFDPVTRGIVEGVVGRGATDSGRTCHVSSTELVDAAALATGFPVGRDYESASLQRFIGQVREFKKIRMLGSAASSLLAVARGQFDAYYEESISLWDVAAGVALVRAAGGDARLTKPESGFRFTVYAGNGLITPTLLRTL
jgi:myo-inositol-1(or 4)-monophosphatase